MLKLIFSFCSSSCLRPLQRNSLRESDVMAWVCRTASRAREAATNFRFCVSGDFETGGLRAVIWNRPKLTMMQEVQRRASRVSCQSFRACMLASRWHPEASKWLGQLRSRLNILIRSLMPYWYRLVLQGFTLSLLV